MKRSLVLTSEGSHTVLCEATGQTFHSMHGSVQESMHVFIHSGLEYAMRKFSQLRILEMGFGTGLNALLTLKFLEENSVSCEYTTVEAHPLAAEMTEDLNYLEYTGIAYRKEFALMHQCPFEIPVQIGNMKFIKRNSDIRFPLPESDHYNLMYFDAFSADKQPELWTEEVFSNIFKAMSPEGVLVTYAAKGSVRRAMQAAGFIVEKLPGPKGKREMLRGGKG